MVLRRYRWSKSQSNTVGLSIGLPARKLRSCFHPVQASLLLAQLDGEGCLLCHGGSSHRIFSKKDGITTVKSTARARLFHYNFDNCRESIIGKNVCAPKHSLSAVHCFTLKVSELSARIRASLECSLEVKMSKLRSLLLKCTLRGETFSFIGCYPLRFFCSTRSLL